MANAVVTGAALFGQMQPLAVPVLILVTGAVVQCALVDHGGAETVLVASHGLNFSALTNTGITAPVFNENDLCLSTLNIEPISPE